MSMEEQIGKVSLDFSAYPGEDFYCDGAVEDELLEIVKNYSQIEYKKLIEEKKSWPILYHLSPLRENIVDWLPMTKNDKVLEVGSGCGAITGVLSRKAGSVTCVDLSKKRSLINAYRHSDCDNVNIYVGNFKDIEEKLPCDFDYICLIGVFEYGQGYMGGRQPYEDFIKILQKHLKENGRIVIAIENKYGLKYFAGCKEDHLGTYFSGISNYPESSGVRTFTRKGLEKIFAACDIEQYSFYYPYPDYKFMTTVYSDAYLPSKGELCNNIRNFDRDRMVLFDERAAFDGIVEDGLFSVFSNSYCVVIGKGVEQKYVKYSNDRAEEYQIKTEICRDEEGKITVKKHPLSEAAKEHIRSIALAYENLKEKYEGGNLAINRCQLFEDAGETWISFEYVDGIPLSELMDECLEKDDIEGFHALFRQYLERTGYHQEIPVADFDMIFSNILVKDEEWTLIDYEWTFGKPIEVKESAFRAIYCYLLEDEKRNKLNIDFILEELGITEKEAEEYREEEAAFQKFVTGQNLSMAEIRNILGSKLFYPTQWIDSKKDSQDAERVQIYEDKGNGYQEEESYFLPEAYLGDGTIECSIRLDGDVKCVRIDPAMDSCVVKIKEVTFNGTPVILTNKKNLLVNGRIAKDGKRDGKEPSIIFPTKDPNINLVLDGLDRQAENMLYLKLEIAFVPLEIAGDLAAAAKKLL